MNILFFGLLLLIIITALTAGFWFGQLPFVSKLRGNASIIDESVVSIIGGISTDQLKADLQYAKHGFF